LAVFSREGSRENENPSLFLSLEEHPVSALSAAWWFAIALEHSGGQENHNENCAK
jgi:hypothetical protein